MKSGSTLKSAEHSELRYLILACIALLAAIGGVAWMSGSSAEEVPLTPLQKVELHVSQADDEASAALAKRVAGITSTFEKARAGAPRFAEAALSWSGKWALVKDYIGIGNDAEHITFLSDAFSEHVLAAPQLKAALESAVQGYLSDLESIQNILLVKLRADMDDDQLNSGVRPAFLQSDEAIAKEFQRLAAELNESLIRDAQVEASKQGVSLVAWEIAVKVVQSLGVTVASELGVEASILSTGAASSVFTLGSGLIIGFIVDRIIAWILKEAGYDPESEVAEKVRDGLRNLEKLLLDGAKEKPGLRGELEKLRQVRSKVQHEVVAKLVSEGATP